MNRSRYAWWWTLAFLAGLLTGCVDRRFVITTEVAGSPPGSPDAGAVVYDEKGQPVGASPVDRQFTYYGKYRFTLVKDGFQTQVVEEQVKTPWYEWFPLDFISENLIPFTIRDVRRFHYVLQPAQMVPAEVVLQQGMEARSRGQTVGPPAVGPTPTIIPGLAPQAPMPQAPMPPPSSSGFSPSPSQPFMAPAADGPRLAPPMPPVQGPPATPGASQQFPAFPDGAPSFPPNPR